MATIRRSISIRAPVAQVFDHIADPTNLPAIWPSLIAVRNIEVHPEGLSFDWEYKLLGLRFRGHAKPVEKVQNQLLVLHCPTGIPSTFNVHYADQAGETVVALEIHYEIPVLGWLATGFVGRINEREADTFLNNLKRKMEEG